MIPYMPILQQEILKLVYRMLYKLLKLPNVMILFEVFLKDMIRLSEREAFFFLEERHNEFV